MTTRNLTASRDRGRAWSVVASYVLVIAALITVMQNVRWLDPSGFKSRHLGAAMVAAWCLGLAVLLLGFWSLGRMSALSDKLVESRANVIPFRRG